MSEHGESYRQDFGPEIAGETIGWVFARDLGNERLLAGIATATVMEGGASYVIMSPDEAGRMPEVSSGFHNVTALTAFVNPSAQVQTDIQIVRTPEMKSSIQGDSKFGSHILDIDAPGKGGNHVGEWGVGGPEVLRGLKERLAEKNATWAYATMYYAFAHISAEDAILGDPEMTRQTDYEAEALSTLFSKANHGLTLNAEYQKNLTIFGNPELSPTEEGRRWGERLENVYRTIGHIRTSSAFERGLDYKDSYNAEPIRSARAISELARETGTKASLKDLERSNRHLDKLLTATHSIQSTLRDLRQAESEYLG